MSCRTCIHWTPTVITNHWSSEEAVASAREASAEERAGAVWGSCTLIGSDIDGYEGSAARANPDVMAYTMDGSDYWAALHTRPTFGCTEETPVAIQG